MVIKRPARQYPVEWDQSGWEQALLRPQETFHPVLELIEGVAGIHHRTQFIEMLVHLPLAFRLPFSIDANGHPPFGDIEESDRRAVVLAGAIYRAMSKLAGAEAARIIRQADVPNEDGTARRIILIRRDLQKKSCAAQLKKLSNAVWSGSQFKIEAAWFGLTPHALEYLEVGVEIARRRGNLKDYAGELAVPATIIPVAMLAPDLLKVVLPCAIRAASLPGGRPFHARDEALAEILRVFVEASGRDSGAARRGDAHEPAGAGADFVRSIETIFRVQLMPKRSTHAIARAKQQMSGSRDRG